MIFLLFCSSFIFIALKSFQQLNVSKHQLAWIVPTSILMSFVEVYVIVTTAKSGWDFPLVIAIGLGSGLGSLTATIIHSRMFKDKQDIIPKKRKRVFVKRST